MVFDSIIKSDAKVLFDKWETVDKEDMSTLPFTRVKISNLFFLWTEYL